MENRKTPKQKSKYKKMLLKGGAVLFSLVLISFTVSAQGFWKELLSENKMGHVAVIMAGEKVSDKIISKNQTETKNQALEIKKLIDDQRNTQERSKCE